MQINLTDREIEAIGNVVDSYLADEEIHYNKWIDEVDLDQIGEHVYIDLEILEELYNKLKRK